MRKLALEQNRLTLTLAPRTFTRRELELAGAAYLLFCLNTGTVRKPCSAELNNTAVTGSYPPKGGHFCEAKVTPVTAYPELRSGDPLRGPLSLRESERGGQFAV